MVTVMKANIKMIRSMAKVNSLELMVRNNMMEITKMVLCMAMESITIPMGADMKANSKRIRSQAKGSSIGKTHLNTMVCTRMIYVMAKAHIDSLTKGSMLVIGRRINGMDMESSIILMGK